MNRNIMKLGVVLVVLYVALFAKLNWIQVVDKNSLDSNPLNTAEVRRDFNRPRGTILTADGAVIAQSVANPDTSSEFKRMRVFPEGELFGQITGYFSFPFRYAKTFRKLRERNSVIVKVRLLLSTHAPGQSWGRGAGRPMTQTP